MTGNTCPAPPPLPGKKGACLLLKAEKNLARLVALDPHWNYNWGAQLVDAQPEDIEFVPMIWGYYGQKTEDAIKDYVIPQIESGRVKRILGFNEPDAKAQSNISVDKALAAWPLLESTGVSIVSPSAAHPDKEWMSEFMKGSKEANCRMDWIGVHWYGGANFQGFANAMKSFHKLFGKPLLVTEFAPADWKASSPADNRWSQAQVLAFMKKALPWLEKQDWIAGYAWFPFNITSKQGTSSALFDEDGNLTALGRFYASVRSDNPNGDQSIEVD